METGETFIPDLLERNTGRTLFGWIGEMFKPLGSDRFLSVGLGVWLELEHRCSILNLITGIHTQE